MARTACYNRVGGEGDPSISVHTVADIPQWQAAKFETHWNQVTADERVTYVSGYTFCTVKDFEHRSDYNRFSHIGISTMGLLSFGGGLRDVRPRGVRRSDTSHA